MPYTQLPSFTGRAKVLHDLQAALIGRTTTLLTQPASFNSIGGLGKTQTAVAFAYRNRNVYQGTFWARGDSDWTMAADFMTIARTLGWNGPTEQAWKQALDFVHTWFMEHQDWLLVIDNVEKPEKIHQWLPADHSGNVLLTSRLQTFGQVGITQQIELGTLQEEEALRFLYKRTGRLDTDSLERKSALQLAQRVGGIPLALDWACAYLTAKEMAFRDYLPLLNSPNVSEGSPHPLSIGTIRETMVSIFKRNLQEIEKESTVSQELLRACAFFHHDWISLEMLSQAGTHLSQELSELLLQRHKEPQAIEKTLACLCQFNLIQWEQEKEGFRLHPFTQDLVKAGLGQDERRLWAGRIVESMRALVPHGDTMNDTVPESLLPHVFAAAKLVQEGMAASRETGIFLRRLGLLVHQEFNFMKAEPFYKGSVTILESALGQHHQDVATCLHDLGCHYQDENRFSEADQFFKRSLIAREAKSGRHHIDLADYLHKLGAHYDDMGRAAQAERLLSRALEIREQTLGKKHEALAEFLHELACRHIRFGQFEQGNHLFSRALDISEEHLGRNHVQVAHRLLEFANSCAEHGRYREAEPLLKRALAIGRKELLHQSPRLSTYILSMARLYHALGRSGQAENLYQEALNLMESTDHPDLAAALNNLGGLYHEQKKYGKAEPFLKRALTKVKTFLPPDHPQLAICLNNVAAVLVAKRRFSEAEPLVTHALSIKEQHLPDDHPALVTILDNYALLLRKLKRTKESSTFGSRAAAIRASQNKQ